MAVVVSVVSYIVRFVQFAYCVFRVHHVHVSTYVLVYVSAHVAPIYPSVWSFEGSYFSPVRCCSLCFHFQVVPDSRHYCRYGFVDRVRSFDCLLHVRCVSHCPGGVFLVMASPFRPFDSFFLYEF